MELRISVLHSECQVLFLGTKDGDPIGFDAIDSVTKELGLPLNVCSTQIVDTPCLLEIYTSLRPLSGASCRPRLLIAGNYLEEQITICALHGLYIGFEVFLLKDFISAKNANHTTVYDTRLVQAGVVPTTLRQLLYEWMSGEDLTERREKMMQFLLAVEK